MNDKYNKTYLGIDYGSRRIGVAKSDPTGLIASPLVTLEVKALGDALRQLRPLIDEYAPIGVIVGYPVHSDGSTSEKCREVDLFIRKLKETYSGPIHRVDESYSSQEAHAIVHAYGKQVRRYKKQIDQLAAVVILQRFLDSQATRQHR